MAADSVGSNLDLEGQLLWGDSAQAFPMQGLGFWGERMPYRVWEDGGVAAILLCCVCLALFVLSRSMRQMLLLLKELWYHRDRNESLLLKSEGELGYSWLHFLMLSLIFGIGAFHFALRFLGREALVLHPHLIMWINVATVFLYLWIKNGILSLFNWTFFSAESSDVWAANYQLINLSKTLWMLLWVASALYGNLPTVVCISLLVLVLTGHELAVLLKTRQIFFDSPLGLFGAISYFCTLELMPIFFLLASLQKINVFLLA